MLGDKAQQPTDDGGALSGGASWTRSSGPRHAAPRKSLLTKLHVPAGKAVALAAMPTAVLMGMGLTPRLAQADEQPPSTFKAGPCVTRSDTPSLTDSMASGAPEPSAGPSASDGSGDAGSTPAPTASPTASSESAAPSPESTEPKAKAKAKAKPKAKAEPKSATTTSPTPSPSPTESSTDLLSGVVSGVGDLLGGLLGGGSSDPTPSPTPTTPSPTPTTPSPTPTTPSASASTAPDPGASTAPSAPSSSSSSAGSSSASDAEKIVKALTDGVGTTSPSASPPASPPASAGADSGTDGTQGYPCPTHDAGALAAAGDKDKEDIPLLPNSPWILKSSLLFLHDLTYEGIVPVETQDETVKDVLKFTATGIEIGDLQQIVEGPNNTTTTVTARAGSTSTFSNGTVTMYTESISGKLLGEVPVTFTPDFPPPLILPELFFTDATVVQAGQFGGDLKIPGMQVRSNQPAS